MKSFLLLSFILQLVSFSFAQCFTIPAALVKPSALFINSEPQTASLSSISHMNIHAGADGPGQCDKYRRERFAGTVMTGVGGGLLCVGLVLVFVGTNDAGYNGFTSATDQGQIIGGASLMVVGAGTMGAGIPLMIIGHDKAKRICGDKDRRYRGYRGGYRDSYHHSYRSRSYMELRTNGRNLALNF